MKFRDRYEPRKSQIEFSGQGRTRQEESEACDINRIIKTYDPRTGQFPEHVLNRTQPLYGDFSDGADFQGVLNRVTEVGALFQSLPARVRRYCNNDPATFLDMLNDDQAVADLEELGIKFSSDDSRPEDSESQREPSSESKTPPSKASENKEHSDGEGGETRRPEREANQGSAESDPTGEVSL